MILVSFGCDRCGATESEEFGRKTLFSEDRVRVPYKWSSDGEGHLLCADCVMKTEPKKED